VIASHSSARELTDHPRNMDDDQLRALRENGGVIQVVAFDRYVKDRDHRRDRALGELNVRFGIEAMPIEAARVELSETDFGAYLAELEQIGERFPRASVADFVDHIGHVVGLIGIDHVGISSDFDGGGGVVGWDDASETLNVTRELVRREYSEEEIRKLWGGNTLRVWRAAEDVAAELQGSQARSG